ncbi:hypothetical protein CKO28_00790 [Rhodovibrio sodomensis]|uniref:Band 7 domain-containing protein n=1 Tax=Rhodovibrio sodomensis TaxID=1088 RepID=A0ABS1DA03_9PROT|nr:SPFH domain-containing protein [Rhodovibrio sodomensis]MBK1666578.1 hypothetical protein [Rhodovibrio sodomensis]
MSPTLILLIAAAVLLMAWLPSCFFVVQQKTAAVVEVFGRFYKVKHPGLRLKFPYPIAKVSGRLSTRVLEKRVEIKTKAKDNAFVTLPVAIQYCAKEDNVRNAWYELSDPEAQLESYVLPSIRSRVNAMDLEELFTDKDSIEQEVMARLTERLDGFGWTIVQVLIDEPRPSEDVVTAYNRVIAAEREKEAAVREGEAHKIREIADAEAAAESKRLQGAGVAQQRAEIAKGMKEAMEEMRQAVPTISDESLVAMTMITNQFETVRDAAQGPNNTILLPYSADSAVDDMRRMVTGMTALGADVKRETPANDSQGPWTKAQATSEQAAE